MKRRELTATGRREPVPRHFEIPDLLARKICRTLEIPEPEPTAGVERGLTVHGAWTSCPLSVRGILSRVQPADKMSATPSVQHERVQFRRRTSDSGGKGYTI